MIKKVKVNDIRPGVFIHDFNCDWGEGNIYIDKMLVKDLKIIEIIKSWGISEVYIDTDRGFDITRPQRNRVQTDWGVTNKQHSHQPVRSYTPSSVPLAVEYKEAISIRREAAQLFEEMFTKVQKGQAPNVSQTYELASRMRSSIRRNHDALLLLTRIRNKDEYTLFHSISVSSLIINVCDYLGLPEERSLDLAVAAMFHDIGKAKVPSAILTKPGRLNMAELSIMKKHVEYSVDMLQGSKNLPFDCYDVALHHHERVDGSGYPQGLTEDKIGFGAQLTSICDVFDAVTSARCYKAAMGTVSGLKVIYEGRGTHFNKKVATNFIRCMGVYPVGSCVRLADGKIGVIAERTEDMHRPVVKVFRDNRTHSRSKPFMYNLSKARMDIEGYANPNAIGLKHSSLLRAIVTQ